MKRKLFTTALNWLSKTIFYSQNQLRPEQLIAAGWITNEAGWYYHPDLKERSRVYINFEQHYYRVYQGREKAFIALEATQEWLYAYLSLLFRHPTDQPLL